MKTKMGRRFISDVFSVVSLLTIVVVSLVPTSNDSSNYSAAVTNYKNFTNTIIKMTAPVTCPTSGAEVVYSNTSNVLYADVPATPTYSSFSSFYNALKSEISANGGIAKCPYEFKLYSLGADSSRSRLLADGYGAQLYVCRGAEIMATLGGREGVVACKKSMPDGGEISFSFWNDYTTGEFVGYSLHRLTSGSDYRIQDGVYGVKVSRLPVGW